MKIKLLSDGDFTGLQDLNFPVEVEAKVSEDGMYQVDFWDMMKIPGAVYFEADTTYGSKYSFFDYEVEVSNE